METHTTPHTTVGTPSKTPLTLLGLGDMGTALARSWLAAGHPLTVWNRTPAKAGPLVDEGARTAATAAGALESAAGPVILCLLDDASVGEALDGADLHGKDLINLTTSTPAQARQRARWAQERGARFLDGGIMAVPPMIGRPETGGYVLYSGDHALFERHREALEVPAGARFVGADAGHAALHDVALLSAMTGMFAGLTHAFALVAPEKELNRAGLATLLTEWLGCRRHGGRGPRHGRSVGERRLHGGGHLQPRDDDRGQRGAPGHGAGTARRSAVARSVHGADEPARCPGVRGRGVGGVGGPARRCVRGARFGDGEGRNGTGRGGASGAAW